MISRTFQIRYQTIAKIILTLSVFSFFGGIFCVYFSPILSFLLSGVFILGLFLSPLLWKSKQWIWCGILFLFGSFLFGWYVIYNEVRDTNASIESIHTLIGKNRKINVYIVRMDGGNESKNRIIGELRQVDDIHLSHNFLININVDRNISPKPGDIVSSIVKLELPKNTTEFRYKEFLQAKNIYLSANIDTFEIVWKNNSFLSSFTIREYIYKQLRSLYPSNQSWLLAAMIFWDKQGITKEYQTLYQETWISHILVVSGSNITLVLILFSGIFTIFPRHFRIFMTITTLLIFVWIVWWGVPVIRAAIMWVLWYLALQWNQKIDPLILLFLVAFGFGIVMSHEIITDASFYLSFFATFGMILFVPFFQKYLTFIPNSIIGLRDTLITTLSATIATTTVLIVSFWQFSLYWPIVNILIWPFIGPITIWGIFSLVINEINHFWWILLAWWVHYWLNIVLSIAEYAHSMPWNLQNFSLSKYESYLICIVCFFFFLFVSLLSFIHKWTLSLGFLKWK